MPKRPRAAATRPPPSNAGAVVSPLRHRPAFLVRLAQLRSFDEFHHHFAGLGVTPAGFSVFALIATNPGIRPGTIAEELRIKPSNVAALVNTLVADGLVERTPDAKELRASLLHATETGMAAWTDMERSADAVDQGFIDGLTAAEARQLVALLRKLLHQ
jgi:DNA-binding MarR family transcriptional regulator